MEFFERSFLPFIRRMGPRVELRLERCGFYPRAADASSSRSSPLRCSCRSSWRSAGPWCGSARGRSRRACRGASQSATREIAVAQEALGLAAEDVEIVDLLRGQGPGNAFSIELEMAHHREVFTGFGEQGVRAEAVAARPPSKTARAYLAAGEPVGEHLADQLVIPLAMSSGGRFRTGPASRPPRDERGGRAPVPRRADRMRRARAAPVGAARRSALRGLRKETARLAGRRAVPTSETTASSGGARCPKASWRSFRPRRRCRRPPF